MDIESLVYKIITGYYYITIDDTAYKVLHPTLKIKQSAHLLYSDAMQKNKFDSPNWIKDRDKENILLSNQIWSQAQETELEAFLKKLEDMKIELYLKFGDPIMKQKIKQTLGSGKKEVHKMHAKKMSMDHMTLESYAHNLKNEQIIISTVFHMDGTPVFTEKDVGADLLESFIGAIAENSIDMDMLRVVARSDIWRSYWDAAKSNIFPPPAYDWTDEQRLLINISKMYDSVREHPECPEEGVIDDDDALDGWILFNKRRADKDRKKNKVMDAIGGKYKNANEIFVVTHSAEESQEIFAMNDASGMAQIRSMSKAANSSTEGVNWAELPHVKAELNGQIQQNNKRRK